MNSKNNIRKAYHYDKIMYKKNKVIKIIYLKLYYKSYSMQNNFCYEILNKTNN